MPRPEAPIETAGPLGQFAVDLRALRASVNVSYRAMEEREHFSYTTFSKAASGQQLPTLAVTKAYVRACQGNVEEWTARWRQVNDALQQAATEELSAEIVQTRRPRGRRARRTELLLVLALTTTLAGAAVAGWRLLDEPAPHQITAELSAPSSEPVPPVAQPFGIVDALDPVLTLGPGARGKRVVRLNNPNSANLVVTELSVAVGVGEDANGAKLVKCIPPLVKVISPPNLPISVAANKSVDAEFVLEMSSSPPEGCENASFPLSYSGRAVIGTVVDGVPRPVE